LQKRVGCDARAYSDMGAIYRYSLQSLPPICTAGAHIWRARTPIICMENVEMHVPDRVLRQFGMNQHISDPVLRLIRVDRSKYRLRDWSVETNAYILKWKDRANQI